MILTFNSLQNVLAQDARLDAPPRIRNTPKANAGKVRTRRLERSGMLRIRVRRLEKLGKKRTLRKLGTNRMQARPLRKFGTNRMSAKTLDKYLNRRTVALDSEGRAPLHTIDSKGCTPLEPYKETGEEARRLEAAFGHRPSRQPSA